MKTWMTRLQVPLLGLAALLGFFLCTAAAPYPSDAPGTAIAPLHRWEKLGQRRVNYSLDRDEILVTARDGRFSALKLVVRKASINLHRVVVYFGNGQHMEVHIRKRIAAGSETRVIGLPGKKRVIKKVVFWYDTRGLARGKAIVELWGRH